MPALPLLQDDADPDFAALIAARPSLSRHAMDGLVLEDVPLARIAAEVGTPTWVYSAGTLRRRARALRAAMVATGLPVRMHFAVKCNPNPAVIATLRAEGFGADVVSEGELLAAATGGVAPAATVFSGVGKSARELRTALASGVGQINAESAAEVEMIAAAAEATGKPARIALRVNPDVDAATHAKITTGRAENKFGVGLAEAPALYARLAALPGVEPAGLAVHIGSQITGTLAYRAAYARVAELARALLAAGHPVPAIDAGGGLGIAYRNEPAPLPEAWAGAIRASLGPLGLPVLLEPGRWLAGPAGVLLASVVLTKAGGTRRFVVLDAAMNDLVRPSLYDAWHGIVPLGAQALVAPRAPADVVGPVCESGDTFARGRALPELAPGAGVAFLDCGAYGAAMSSGYNLRPLAAEVMVDGDRYAVVRERQSHAALLAGTRLPPWLHADG